MQQLFKTTLRTGIASALISTASAAITFNFTYADVANNSNFGFDDATDGATRRSTVEAVGAYLNTVLDHTATVDINWTASSNSPGGSTLASMGTSYFTNRGTYAGILHQHITTGSDPTGAAGDGSGSVNFGRIWNSDMGNAAGNEFDLFTVVLHELTHALGFASLMESDGSHSITGTYSTYDTFLRDASGTQMVNNAGTLTGNANDLTSGNMTIVTDDGTFDIYSPNPYENGSSISHIAASSNAIMNPSVAPGLQKREYLAADRAVLKQLGYTLKPVPEPSSTLLIGLGFAGFLLRRKK